MTLVTIVPLLLPMELFLVLVLLKLPTEMLAQLLPNVILETFATTKNVLPLFQLVPELTVLVTLLKLAKKVMFALMLTTLVSEPLLLLKLALSILTVETPILLIANVLHTLKTAIAQEFLLILALTKKAVSHLASFQTTAPMLLMLQTLAVT